MAIRSWLVTVGKRFPPRDMAIENVDPSNPWYSLTMTTGMSDLAISSLANSPVTIAARSPIMARVKTLPRLEPIIRESKFSSSLKNCFCSRAPNKTLTVTRSLSSVSSSCSSSMARICCPVAIRSSPSRVSMAVATTVIFVFGLTDRAVFNANKEWESPV